MQKEEEKKEAVVKLERRTNDGQSAFADKNIYIYKYMKTFDIIRFLFFSSPTAFYKFYLVFCSVNTHLCTYSLMLKGQVFNLTKVDDIRLG